MVPAVSVSALYLVFPFPSVSQPGVADQAVKAGSGYGGGISVTGGTVVLLADTLNANIAQGGEGGTGGHGGTGPLAELGDGSLSIGTGTGTGTGGGTTLSGGGGGGTAANTAGAGGNGGNGATGQGGGLYVSGGAITLVNATVAANSAEAGAVDRPAKGERPARAS